MAPGTKKRPNVSKCFKSLWGLFGGWFWYIMLLHTWVSPAFFGMFGRLPNGCCSPGPSDWFRVLGRAMLPTRRKSRNVGVASWFGHVEATQIKDNKSSLRNSAELCNLNGFGTHHNIFFNLIWWAEQLDRQKWMNPVCTNFALCEKQGPQQHIGSQDPYDKSELTWFWCAFHLLIGSDYRIFQFHVIKDAYRSWWFV